MTLQDVQSVKAECRDLIHRLTYLVDHHLDDEATALFAPDAFWLRGGKTYHGHDEIQSSFAGTEKLIIRHFVSTLVVDASDAAAPKATTYYALYKGEGEIDVEPLPMPIPTLFSMGEWHDKFRFVDGEWRIASREVQRLFQCV